MTKQLVDHMLVERLAAPMHRWCDRYAYELQVLNVDMDMDILTAVIALLQHQPLPDVLATISLRHPLGERVQERLRVLYKRVWGVDSAGLTA